MELLRRKNSATAFDAPLISSANRPYYKSSATLVPGDVRVIRDGLAPVNIAALPTEVGSTGLYRIVLSAAEMDAATITVLCVDAAGNEWDPLTVTLCTLAADELHLAKAALVNKREHEVATGVDVIKEDDGATTLRTLTPSEEDGIITVTPS